MKSTKPKERQKVLVKNYITKEEKIMYVEEYGSVFTNINKHKEGYYKHTEQVPTSSITKITE